ncbi:hypothetical protein ACKWTF_006680 [Chironomus riparius]
MDSSAFTSENESLSEVETLKQQLNTYKMINADLSKKIQQLKVELNAFKQENSVIKRQVLEERAKSVEYRQLFTTMNTHCINFINTYVNSMQQINENDASLIDAIPGILGTPKSDDDHDSPQNLTVVPQIERPQRAAQHTVRSQLRAALNEDENAGSNVLNTILEESMPIFTSTPIVPNRAVSANLGSPIPFITPSPATPIIPQNMFKSPKKGNLNLQTPVIPQSMFKSPKNQDLDLATPVIPQSMFKSPKNNNTALETPVIPQSMFKSPLNQNSVPEVRPHDTSETVLETPKSQAIPSTRRYPVDSEDEIAEYQTDGEDMTEQTVQHDTIKEVKSLRVALSPLKSAYLRNNNNNNTHIESPEYESYEDESTIGSSQFTENSSRALKRKSSESGRPRRKARPDPKSLKEPSLRTKLRRSKRKT